VPRAVRNEGRLKPHQVSPTGKEWSEFDIDELNREAFGFTESDIKTVKPSELQIKWTDDLDQVDYEIKNSGKSPEEWARGIDTSSPIDIILEDGAFKIDDGHHRYMAAKILDKDIPTNLEIKDQPFVGLARRATERGEEVHPDIMKAATDRGFKPQSLPMDEASRGFDRTTTDMPYYDDLIESFDSEYKTDYFREQKGIESRMVDITPDQYLSTVDEGFVDGGVMNGIDDAKVKKYADKMRNGEQFPALTLDYAKGKKLSQEGRHRALAAKQAGIDSVPVVVVTPTPEEAAYLGATVPRLEF
jgi:hypothetical protein